MLNRTMMVASVVGCLAWTSAANADTLVISYQVDGGGFFNLASGTGTAGGTANPAGFSIQASAAESPPLPGVALHSNTLSIQTGLAGSHTIDVWVTSQQAVAAASWLSSFTTNLMASGWSVRESTAVGVTELAFALFNSSNQTAQSVNNGPAGTFIYEWYHIITNGAGSVNATIDMVQTPIPAALPLFISGLLGL